MSAYLVTREGQELGSFEASQIQDGLKTGRFLPTDWAWREGMPGWQGLTEIFGAVSAPKTQAHSSSLSALVRKSTGPKPPDSINPYAPPASNVVMTRTSGELPFAVIEELRNTRPWVMFIAVLMWIIGGGFLILLMYNIFFVGNPAGRNVFNSGSLVSMVSYLVGLGLGFALVAYLIIHPALKLTRYALNIARLSKTESFSDLVAALSEQRRFWRFQGILCIAYVGFALLLFIWTLAVR